MIDFDLAHIVRQRIADDIQVEQASADTAVVYMPFVYDDGDQCSIIVTRNANNLWRLTDDGDVIKRAFDAGIDLRKPQYADRLKTLIDFYGVSEQEGVLDIKADDNRLAESLFTLTQTCLEATWLGKPRQQAQSQESRKFAHRLDKLVSSAVSAANIERFWYDKEHDQHRIYPIDYRIAGKRKQLFLFGVPTQLACLKATIACQHFKIAGAKFISVAVFDHEEELPRRSAEQLKVVVDKSFPRVGENRPISTYLQEFAA